MLAKNGVRAPPRNHNQRFGYGTNVFSRQGVRHQIGFLVVEQTWFRINHCVYQGVDLYVDSVHRFFLFFFVGKNVMGISAGHGHFSF